MRQQRIRFVYWMILVAASFSTVTGLAEDQSPEGLIIDRIEVAGNVTLTRAEVLAVVRARPGQPFQEKIVDEDSDRIGELSAAETAYSNVKIEDNKVVLTYVVIEHNLVRILAFEGNKKLKDSVLLKELDFRKGDYLDEFKADAGVDAIKEKYKKKGFAWATVKLDKGGLAFGQVTYRIEEGARTKIRKVQFEGNETISGRKLQGTIKTRKRKLLLFPVYYDPEQIETDRKKLLEVYQRQSFLDADVSSSVTFSEDKKKAFVTFSINEGPVYFVDSIEYIGNKFFLAEQLQVDSKLQTDYYYSEAWATFDAKKIESMYGEKGFVEVRVQEEHEKLEGQNRVRVVFRIEEGSQYHIREVTISGNETFRDRTIRRIMDEDGFSPGQLYNKDIARGDVDGDGNGDGELEKVIRQSVVAGTVTITPRKPSDGSEDIRDALVKITEGQTGSVMVGAGVGSDDGVVGQISLTQKNFDITDTPDRFSDIFTGKAFRGAGQQFRMVASPGTEYSSYSISFTEPYLYDRPVALNTSASYFERDRDTYDEERVAGRISLEKRYPDKWRRGIRFRAEDVEISGLDWDAPQDVRDEEGSNILLGTRFFVRKDTTDSRFLPSKGTNFDFGYEQVFGDYTFGILEGAYRWYTTLYEDLNELKTVLETKVQAGTTIGDAPTFERYYLGGTGKWGVRGFEYRGISPRQGPSDEPVGSEWAMIGSAEIAVPLGNETFSWLFFADAGMIDDGGPRASVGTGIQLMIPQYFGPVPMRFEVAAPFMDDGQDETQTFSFSVGALF